MNELRAFRTAFYEVERIKDRRHHTKEDIFNRDHLLLSKWVLGILEN